MKYFAILLLLLTLQSQVWADSQHAHVHGNARAGLILDGNTLVLEIESPAANILGFEYQPKSASELELYNVSDDQLKRVESVVTVSDNCSLVDAAITWPFDIDAHRDEHDHDEHDHDEEHHSSHELHNDISLSYQWQCVQANKIELQFNVFETFKGFEKLVVEWIAFNHQKSQVLGRQSTRLVLEP
jgi:hypothetical protein